jgi:hypothetical protein
MGGNIIEFTFLHLYYYYKNLLPKTLEQIFLKVDQKYPHLLGGKFCKWGYKYHDILQVDFNRKKI